MPLACRQNGRDKRNKTSFYPCPSAESSVSTPSPQAFLFQLSPQTSASVFPLHSFPIWPGQRLGLRDPGTLWLDVVVTSDLDLEKRYGSGSQQTSCSTRDPSLASVSSPSSATRLGIAGSLSRSGLAPRHEDVLASVEVDSDKDETRIRRSQPPVDLSSVRRTIVFGVPGVTSPTVVPEAMGDS